MLIEGSNKMIMGSHRNTNVYLKKKKKKSHCSFFRIFKLNNLRKEVILLDWTAHSLCPNTNLVRGVTCAYCFISQVKEFGELSIFLLSYRLCSYTLSHEHLPEPTPDWLHQRSWLFVHIEVDCSVFFPPVASFSCQIFLHPTCHVVIWLVARWLKRHRGSAGFWSGHTVLWD